MSKNTDDKKSYSAADIQHYLGGHMPAEQMHALEKAALEDPFLADAVEGYGITDAGENNSNLAALHKALQEKSRSRKVIPFYKRTGFRAAAAILLLAGGVSLVYMVLVRNEVQQLALNRQEATTPVPAGDTATQVLLSPEAGDSGQTAGSNRTPPAGSLPSPPATPLPIPAAEEVAPVDQTMVKREMVKERPEAPPTLSAGPPTQTNDRMSSITLSQKAARKKATQEDERENSADSASDEEIIVIGYSNQKKRIANGAVTSIVESYIDTSEAVPVNGVGAFSDYIRTGKKLPGGDTALHGDVVVGFIVKRSGKLKDVKIVQSVSPSLDQEAIRLIKDGPAWIRKQPQGRATVTIRF